MELQTSSERFESQLNGLNDRECMLVLDSDQRVQGWGVVKRYSDRAGYRVACESSIYFRREATGRGFGKRMQCALMEKVREFGYHHIVAKIFTSNVGSIRFHEALGYQLVGVQKEVGYLNGKWHDVSILQCILSDVEPYKPDLA
jgi:L-amino acid N-acyltransferase YncA